MLVLNRLLQQVDTLEETPITSVLDALVVNPLPNTTISSERPKRRGIRSMFSFSGHCHLQIAGRGLEI